MRRITVALIAAGVVIVVLAGTQVALPRIAADHLRAQLSTSGKVIDVEVSALPAIELLWHHADNVNVRMDNYHSSTSQLSSLLDESSDVATLHASAHTLTDGLLTLHDTTLTKSGSTLTGSGKVLESDLRSAVPFLQSVTPVASSHGQLIVRGTGTFLGLTASIDALVHAQDGKLLVTAELPFGFGGFTLTLFSDPHVVIKSVSATSAPGGFALTAQGHLS